MESPRVNTDPVGQPLHFICDAVAMNDQMLVANPAAGKLITYPDQIFSRLLLQGHIRADAGVDKAIVSFGINQAAGTQEVEVVLRQFLLEFIA